MSEDNIISYNENSDFNQWLDSDETNVVTIKGFSFPPSEVLYLMNYSQYCQALEEYLNDDSLLMEEVCSEFPTPIAFYLNQAEQNYDSPHHRLDLLKSCWESLVFTIYGLVVGEARHRKVPLKEVGIKLDDYYSDRLGQKLTIVENILNYCLLNGYKLKCSEIITLDAVTTVRELNKKRNGFEHSFAATPEKQVELYNELLPELLYALKQVRDIQKITLFRYHSSPGGVLLPRCDVFNGHSLDGAKKILRVNRDDFTNCMDYFTNMTFFAHIEEDEIFCVSPFIHFSKETNDTHPVITFFKKKISGARYEFEAIGRPQPIVRQKADFMDRDNDLRNLIF